MRRYDTNFTYHRCAISKRDEILKNDEFNTTLELLNIVDHWGLAREGTSRHDIKLLSLGLRLRLRISANLLQFMLVGRSNRGVVSLTLSTAAAALRRRILLDGDTSIKIEIQDSNHGQITENVPPEASIEGRTETRAKNGVVLHAPNTSGTKDTSRQEKSTEFLITEHGDDLEDQIRTARDENDAQIQIVKGIINLVDEGISPCSDDKEIGEEHWRVGTR
jgi:hypothetical protein